jgi:hypothetical protein
MKGVTEYINKITEDWQVEISNQICRMIHQAIPEIDEQINTNKPSMLYMESEYVFFSAKNWLNVIYFMRSL